ncbi:MAG: L-rhamnose isomerase [Victivallaceae bacterium]|nr:L-rhamnose isomerase [Victivallaceae bacterium]
MNKAVNEAYQAAKERYAAIGVDTDAALAQLQEIPVSIHCWQGDDVGGFEVAEPGSSGGGIMATGNYPGRAGTPEELRADLAKALSLIPGKHRLNLHACYLESGGEFVDRDRIRPEHFKNWVEWAKSKGMGMDFNPTFFAHPKADSGFTLSSNDDGIRNFWIAHGKACRRISEYIGKELGSPCVMNIWIPDGFKDIPVDRNGARARLKASLDEMCAEKLDPKYHLDAVESKLFGLGSESCVIGSHEFYMGYAVKNNLLLCLDTGHFHPTEAVSDKISSVLQFLDEILLHVSRPVRWDSDHVVTYNEELLAIAQEIIRNKFQDRVHIGLDFFDASINRIAAWVIGSRNMLKALCAALLEPSAKLKRLENAGNYTSRLAILEEQKFFPLSGVWDYYCAQQGVPAGLDWLAEVEKYEKKVLNRRNG